MNYLYTERRVQRDRLLPILKPKIPCRELDGVCRLEGVHVDLQALGLGVVGGLDLDGDELALPLDDKVDLGAPLGLPVEGLIAVYGELDVDVVLREPALEIIKVLHHVEQVVGGQVLFGCQEPQVGDVDLKSVDVPVVFQGLFDLLHLEDLGHDARKPQPLDGVLKLGGPPALFDELILKARVLLGELHRDAVVAKPGLLDFVEVVVLAHVVEVACQNGVLNVPDQHIVVGLDKLGDALRHTAHHKVLPVEAHSRLMQGGGHGGVRLKAMADLTHQRVLAQGQHELLQVHGVEGLHVHLAHGEGEPRPVDRHAQQTSRRNDVVVRRLLAEIFEGGQGPLAELDLVKYDQRLLPHDGLPGDVGQDRNQIVGADALVKCLGKTRIRLKIEIRHILIARPAKLQNGIGLPHLPRPLQNQGLAVSADPPALQILHDFPNHSRYLPLMR